MRVLFTVMLLVGVTFCAVLLSGCAPKQKKADEAYKIGAILSITGRASPIGQPEKETVELLQEQINKAGGINGHKVEIIVEDDAGDETKAVMAAKKLLNKDNVLAVVGPSLSGTTLAIVKLFEESQTPMVSCAASVKITDPVQKWIFQVALTDRYSIPNILRYLESKGIKKIAFISDSNAYGQSGLAEMENTAPQKGFEIVAKETFGGEDTDMTPQLTRIKGTDAQAVVCWGTNPGPAVITRNMKQLKMTIPLIQSQGVANAKYIELSGDAANGVVMPAGRMIVTAQLAENDPQKPILLEYQKAFEAKYKKTPDHYGGHAYDAVKLIFKALEKVGPDKALIRDEIEKTTNFVGIDGIFNYSATNHNGLSEDSFEMVQIVDGKWTILKTK